MKKITALVLISTLSFASAGGLLGSKRAIESTDFCRTFHCKRTHTDKEQFRTTVAYHLSNGADLVVSFLPDGTMTYANLRFVGRRTLHTLTAADLSFISRSFIPSFAGSSDPYDAYGCLSEFLNDEPEAFNIWSRQSDFPMKWYGKSYMTCDVTARDAAINFRLEHD